MNLLAGFEKPDTGQVTVDGIEVAEPGSHGCVSGDSIDLVANNPGKCHLWSQDAW